MMCRAASGFLSAVLLVAGALAHPAVARAQAVPPAAGALPPVFLEPVPGFPAGQNEDFLLTGQSGWDIAVEQKGKAGIEVVLGQDLEVATLKALRLHFAWRTGTEWQPDNHSLSFAAGGSCQFELRRDGAVLGSWKAACGMAPVALKVPPKVSPGPGTTTLAIRFLDFRPTPGIDKKVPLSVARLRMLYARGARPGPGESLSPLFFPHEGVASLMEGRNYSWSLGQWVSVGRTKCEEPCEAECACKVQVKGPGGQHWVGRGDLLGPGALEFSPSGDWALASRALLDYEPGAPIVARNGGIAMHRGGTVVRIPEWQAGTVYGDCSQEEACRVLCGDRGESGGERSIERRFQFRESGSAVTLVATDTVTPCGGEGRTKSRVTEIPLVAPGATPRPAVARTGSTGPALKPGASLAFQATEFRNVSRDQKGRSQLWYLARKAPWQCLVTEVPGVPGDDVMRISCRQGGEWRWEQKKDEITKDAPRVVDPKTGRLTFRWEGDDNPVSRPPFEAGCYARTDQGLWQLTACPRSPEEVGRLVEKATRVVPAEGVAYRKRIDPDVEYGGHEFGEFRTFRVGGEIVRAFCQGVLMGDCEPSPWVACHTPGLGLVFYTDEGSCGPGDAIRYELQSIQGAPAAP